MNSSKIFRLLLFLTISLFLLKATTNASSNKVTVSSQVESYLFSTKDLLKRKRRSCEVEGWLDIIKTITNPKKFLEGTEALMDITKALFGGSDSYSNCDLAEKLDTIIHKLDDLKAQINCVNLERNIDDIHLNIKNLENILLSYKKDHGKSGKSSVQNHCKSSASTTSLQYILTLFHDSLSEKKVQKYFENCCFYKHKCVEQWADQMRILAALFVVIITECEEVVIFKTNFKKCTFLEEINEKIIYYTDDFLLEKFVKDDSSDHGLKKTVENIYNLDKKAVEIVGNLKTDFSFFDWDAIFFKTDSGYGVLSNPNHYLCGSRFFVFQRGWPFANRNLLISWCIPKKITESYNSSMENACFFSGYPDPHPVQKANRKLSESGIYFTDFRTNHNKEICNKIKNLENISYKNKIDVGWILSERITSWGGWGQIENCENAFVIGFSIKVQAPNSESDNTAMNGLQLICENSHFIQSSVGEKGTWGSDVFCDAGSKVNGFNLNVEGPKGSSWFANTDDTSVNSIELSCSNGKYIKPNNGLSWGSWGSWKYCPQGSYVCGLHSGGKRHEAMRRSPHQIFYAFLKFLSINCNLIG